MKYRKVKPETIQVATAYQRALRTTMVSAIARNYEEEAFGVLVVGERGDGSLWCVDGQTRLKAALKVGLNDVPCLVFSSKGKEHEATLFRLLNTQTNQSKMQRFKAQLCEGDPDSQAIFDEVERAGFSIAINGERAWPYIRTVMPIEKAYKRGVLTRTLNIINGAWGADRDVQALQVPVIGGLAGFLAVHGEVINDSELIRRLQRYTVAQLVAKCEARKMQGGSRAEAMREVLVAVWNHNRKKRIGEQVGETVGGNG